MLNDVMLDVSQRLLLRDCIISVSNDAKKYRDLGYNKEINKKEKEYLYKMKYFFLDFFFPDFYEENPNGNFFAVYIIHGYKVHKPIKREDKIDYLSVIKTNSNLFIYNKPKRSTIRREVYEGLYNELRENLSNINDVINKFLKIK